MVGELKRSLSWRALKKPIRAFHSWTRDSSTLVFSNKKKDTWLILLRGGCPARLLNALPSSDLKKHVQSPMCACLWAQSSIHHYPVSSQYKRRRKFILQRRAKPKEKYQRNKSMFSTNWALHTKQIPEISTSTLAAEKEMVKQTNNVQMFSWTARETWIATSIHTAVKGARIESLFQHARFVHAQRLYVIRPLWLWPSYQHLLF